MTDDRPVLVGEAPSRTAGRDRAFDGRSGARLCEAIDPGMTVDDLPDLFEMVNLLDEYPGSADGKGSLFPRQAARDAADDLADDLDGRLVLIVGKRAAAAFRVTPVEYFEPIDDGPGRRAYVVPHPSGVNRWWNDEGNRARARRFLSAIVDGREPNRGGTQ